MRTARCIDCGRVFEVQKAKGALPQRCPEHAAERTREMNRLKRQRWTDANRERAREQWNKYNRKRLADPEHLRGKREAHMLRKYGLTPEQFDNLLASQGGGCAICGGERRGPGLAFHVDHCHETGKVRGLLCGPCNTAIGLLGDDPERAEKAAAYLRR